LADSEYLCQQHEHHGGDRAGIAANARALQAIAYGILGLLEELQSLSSTRALNISRVEDTILPKPGSGPTLDTAPGETGESSSGGEKCSTKEFAS